MRMAVCFLDVKVIAGFAWSKIRSIGPFIIMAKVCEVVEAET